MRNKRLAKHGGGVALALLAALGLNVAVSPAANAAINNCPLIGKFCSTYASREETRDLYTVSRGPVGHVDSSMCSAVFTSDDGGALFECKTLVISGRDKERFNKVLTDAYRANGCIEFYSPTLSKTAGLIPSKAKVHTGKFCKDT